MPETTEITGTSQGRYWVNLSLTRDGQTQWEQQKVYTILFDHDGWYYQSVAMAEDVVMGQASLLRPVLRGDNAFFDVQTGENRLLNDLWPMVTSDETVTVEAESFAPVDMDGDGASEVVLRLGPNETYGFVVLWEKAGGVYGQWFSHRTLENLKADGTFTVSGGAGDQGIGTLILVGSSCRTDQQTRSETTDGVQYFVDGEPATREAFEQETRRQAQKDDAPWYDFTAANVETYCP